MPTIRPRRRGRGRAVQLRGFAPWQSEYIAALEETYDEGATERALMRELLDGQDAADLDDMDLEARLSFLAGGCKHGWGNYPTEVGDLDSDPANYRGRGLALVEPQVEPDHDELWEYTNRVA